jgi:hypothetical protein
MATNGSFAVSPSIVLSKTLVKNGDMEFMTLQNGMDILIDLFVLKVRT